MVDEVPSSDNFTGLSRTVLVYSERFSHIVESLKDSDPTDADWASLEELVDVDNFVRRGVFLTEKPETINWPTYRSYITQYGGATHWEATLRHLTEQGSHVVLELQERNTRAGFTSIANTAMAYTFNDQGRVTELDVYVMRLN